MPEVWKVLVHMLSAGTQTGITNGAPSVTALLIGARKYLEEGCRKHITETIHANRPQVGKLCCYAVLRTKACACERYNGSAACLYALSMQF